MKLDLLEIGTAFAEQIGKPMNEWGHDEIRRFSAHLADIRQKEGACAPTKNQSAQCVRQDLQ